MILLHGRAARYVTLCTCSSRCHLEASADQQFSTWQVYRCVQRSLEALQHAECPLRIVAFLISKFWLVWRYHTGSKKGRNTEVSSSSAYLPTSMSIISLNPGLNVRPSTARHTHGSAHGTGCRVWPGGVSRRRGSHGHPLTRWLSC